MDGGTDPMHVEVYEISAKTFAFDQYSVMNLRRQPRTGLATRLLANGR